MNTDRLSLTRLLSFCLIFILPGCDSVISQPNVKLTPWGSAFNQPIDLVPWINNKFILIEKAGKVKTVDENGSQLSDVLDIKSHIADAGGERGLLGLALHPAYPDSPYIYLNHTDKNNHTAVVRYVFHPDSSKINPNTRKILLTVEQPYSNHNGGCIVFGPDGYMYIGMGDGGSGGDPENRAQNLNSLLGKILRIDVDKGDPYAIPEDNPFVKNPNARNEIWSYGWRNPWRFSFDRKNGDLWVGDVGQNKVEEISFESSNADAGLNYGWRCYEGDQPYKLSGDCIGPYVDPIITRTHNMGDRSITGGYRYRGPVAGFERHYFFGDYVSGNIYMAILNDSSTMSLDSLITIDKKNSIASFAEDKDGNLFVLSLSGQIYKFFLSCNIATPNLKIHSPGRYAIGVENDSLYQQYVWFYSESSDQKQDFMAVDTTTNPVLYGIRDGNYYVTGVASNDCRAESEIINVIISSIKAVDFYDIEIFPNPATDVLTIQTQAVLSNATIEIWNRNGQLIKQMKSALPGTISLQNLPNGLYFLKFLAGQKIYVTKVMKE